MKLINDRYVGYYFIYIYTFYNFNNPTTLQIYFRIFTPKHVHNF
jgi:hypothetical protein